MNDFIEGEIIADEAKTMEAPGSALVVINALNPVALYQPEKISDLLTQIRAEAYRRIEGADETTEAGRKIIRSAAYFVARSKTAMDDQGLDLTAEYRSRVGVINEERGKIKANLDALKAEITAKADAFEAAEAARLQGHKDALAELIALSVITNEDPTLQEIEDRIEALTHFPSRQWEGFAVRAEDAWTTGLATLERIRSNVKKREDDRAELEKLRAAQAKLEALEAKRAQDERERQIAAKAAEDARLAAEANTHRLLAEERAKAAREADELALKARAAEQKAAQDQEAAAQAIKDAEARAAQAKQDADTAAALAVTRAAEAKEAADRQAQEARDAATKAEQKRRAAEDQKAADAAKARADDVEHRKGINGKALKAIVTAISATGTKDDAEKIGKAVIAAVIKGQIPAISIQY